MMMAETLGLVQRETGILKFAQGSWSIRNIQLREESYIGGIF